MDYQIKLLEAIAEKLGIDLAALKPKHPEVETVEVVLDDEDIRLFNEPQPKDLSKEELYKIELEYAIISKRAKDSYFALVEEENPIKQLQIKTDRDKLLKKKWELENILKEHAEDYT